jgi:hypothetical protein
MEERVSGDSSLAIGDVGSKRGVGVVCVGTLVRDDDEKRPSPMRVQITMSAPAYPTTIQIMTPAPRLPTTLQIRVLAPSATHTTDRWNLSITCFRVEFALYVER